MKGFHVSASGAIQDHHGPLVNEMNLFNSLPNNKILDVIKFKGFACDKINVAQMLISVFDRVENSVGKGEKCQQHFSPFPALFSKGVFLRVVKSQDCVLTLYHTIPTFNDPKEKAL